MSKKHSMLILPGDGIGPEAMVEVKKVVAWLTANKGIEFDISEDEVGGAAYDKYGTSLADHTLEKAKEVDAVMFGAVGGPKWDGVEYSLRPEAGLLKLRKELNLFANLRPALCFEPLVDASSLKPELVSGLDIMILRELTGGVYFGEPRGIEELTNGQRRGVNTQVYETYEIHRIGHVAFDLARKRNGKVTSSEKANVMESGLLWREEMELIAKDYPDVEYENMLADNCGMQLVRAPKQFDVIVTDNLFGDMLSDVAAMLTGSLGMLPSASLGEKGKGALYEPVHGSAPDIAGQGKANPIATILSFAMALRYTYDEGDAADLIENAVNEVLANDIRTADINQPGMTLVSTSEMGSHIVDAMEKLSN
ncbi:3-isopropylmalate dehydrogenase [Pseudemcibacter aquimaris]|uniref:3-isopropylmalate dehydrogenase n=1 Tax=Pseudemcibacter aquimaris TaxID=2857064 RepID=UPI002011660E|nr:3-isopropylmalate dehydrogenase [Pseudemcibacter aquimaris]MCC3861970.1 3-isopropylmalate dehydrogenase [Pseudemcibacter aquimaris]WDU58722.1 3-isopropylmalate dehydrogenase [Pseudemcibacter aquimaris]